MDWLQFISSMTASLAWPLAVIGFAFAFRKGIAATLARPLRRMRAGPVEAEWEEQAAEAVVDVANSPETADRPPPSLREDPLRAVARRSPQAAVMAAYAQIEQALRRKLIESGYLESDRRPMGARQLTEVAVQREVISPQIAEAIRSLTVMRNIAAHGGGDELDADRAFEFLALARAIVYAVDPQAENPPAGRPD